MNPARSLGPAVIGGLWQGHWIYWVAPISAMLVATRVYGWVRHAQSPHGNGVRIEGVVGAIEPQH